LDTHSYPCRYTIPQSQDKSMDIKKGKTMNVDGNGGEST